MDLLCTENLRTDYDCEVPYVPTQMRAHTYAQTQLQPHLQSQHQPTTIHTAEIALESGETESNANGDISKEQTQTKVMLGAPSPYSNSSSSLLSPGGSSSPSSGYNSATSSHASQTHIHNDGRQYHQENDIQKHQHYQQSQQQQQHQHQQQQQSLLPNTTPTHAERKPSVKRQVSWGPPTVAEADTETLKLTITPPASYKPNGCYGNNNISNNKINTNYASMT
uniref:Uncharacterized protein n=1 Tax=Ceratitis capitata TaxID=7213 RepID=W8AK96_CERCA